jgi:hypothetical protein
MSRLDTFTRAIEQGRHPEADVAAAINHERRISPALGGRTVLDDQRLRGPKPRPRTQQLNLFAK